jgi:rubrerythrin
MPPRRTSDAATRQLLGRLAAAEAGHESTWQLVLREHLAPGTRRAEDAEAHRQFVLTWVQPGLAGLMDGSLSIDRKGAAFIRSDRLSTHPVARIDNMPHQR